MPTKKQLSVKQQESLLLVLKNRFEKNKQRHKAISWDQVLMRFNSLKADVIATKLWSVNEMEITGGEPDIIGRDKQSGAFIFCDCAAESPKERRSLCYDREGLDARKEFKPKSSVMEMAAEMGIELLTENQYRDLQKLGSVDNKTSSWILTPPDIRKLGGALFADYRYGSVFVYHNGVSSYYASRGFRGLIKV